MSRPDSTIEVEQQDVVLALVEGRHLVLQLGRRHLAVCDHDLRLRHAWRRKAAALVEIFDARADVEAGRRGSARAAAPRAPAARRRARRRCARRGDRPAGVAMIERSRTPVMASCSVRGIGVAERVSTCTSARRSFRRSLCFTPKCCSSSTITSPRSLNETPGLPSTACVPTTMSTSPAAAPALATRIHVGGRHHARELRDLDRQVGEALGEILEVLAREQRGRRDDDHLLAVDGAGEGGAHRDLGLAEADVAADQPVHRMAGAEIVERGLDRGEPGPPSRRRGSRRRTRRRARRGHQLRRGSLVARAAAILMRPAAISSTRLRMRALRFCQPAPPSRSSCTSVSSEP